MSNTINPSVMQAFVPANVLEVANKEAFEYSQARDKAWRRLRKLVQSGASNKAIERAARSVSS